MVNQIYVPRAAEAEIIKLVAYFPAGETIPGRLQAPGERFYKSENC